jgi:hypothetical protein
VELIIKLADAPGLEEAVQKLTDWYDDPATHLAAAGQIVYIGTPSSTNFGWRITGLTAVDVSC